MIIELLILFSKAVDDIKALRPEIDNIKEPKEAIVLALKLVARLAYIIVLMTAINEWIESFNTEQKRLTKTK